MPNLDLFQTFRDTIETGAKRLSGIDEQTSGQPGGEGQWSRIQVLGHMIDSAANNHQRFVRAQFADHLMFEGYDQEAWVRVQRYDQASWPSLVQLWKDYNLHLLHVVSQIPEPVLTQPRLPHSLKHVGKKLLAAGEPATLEDLIRDYIDHTQNHLRQILDEGNSIGTSAE